MSESLRKSFLLIGLAFALLIAGIIWTLKIAIDNHTENIDPRYYEKGLDYQKYVTMQERAKKEGWRKPTLEKDNNAFLITLKNDQGIHLDNPDKEIIVRVQFNKPAVAGPEYTAKFVSQSCVRDLCKYRFQVPQTRWTHSLEGKETEVKILATIGENMRVYANIREE